MSDENQLPTYFHVEVGAYNDAIKAIELGLDYARDALIVHDETLGRSLYKNRRWAENIESDIQEMQDAMQSLGKLNSGC